MNSQRQEVAKLVELLTAKVDDNNVDYELDDLHGREVFLPLEAT